MPDPDNQSSLALHLDSLIRGNGPLTIEQWMGQVLSHPKYGYYMREEPFGVDGDFTTAPEISQMFGEMLGFWAAHTWQQMGAPERINLVEIGPGRGTLLADALRAAQTLPDFAEAIDLHLVETSPRLRDIQQSALSDQGGTWHHDLSELPDGPMILLCNELFDALPIRQFIHTAEGWRERLVDLDPESEPLAPVFRFVVSPGTTAAFALIDDEIKTAGEGSIAELCPGGLRLVHDIAKRLQAQGGAALIIDYGYAASQTGDTLQSVSKHTKHDVLETPGKADICALVNFAMLAQSAREAGAVTSGPIEQGHFLKALGIETRAEKLKSGLSLEKANVIEAALERLTAANAMGKLFKVMAIRPAGAPALAAFEDTE